MFCFIVFNSAILLAMVPVDNCRAGVLVDSRDCCGCWVKGFPVACPLKRCRMRGDDRGAGLVKRLLEITFDAAGTTCLPLLANDPNNKL